MSSSPPPSQRTPPDPWTLGAGGRAPPTLGAGGRGPPPLEKATPHPNAIPELPLQPKPILSNNINPSWFCTSQNGAHTHHDHYLPFWFQMYNIVVELTYISFLYGFVPQSQWRLRGLKLQIRKGSRGLLKVGCRRPCQLFNSQVLTFGCDLQLTDGSCIRQRPPLPCTQVPHWAPWRRSPSWAACSTCFAGGNASP